MDDEESMGSMGTGGSGPKYPRKPVGFNMTSQQIIDFEKVYGITPITRPSEPPHPHPHLAYQRNTLERAAFKYALALDTGKVADVGSAAKRVRDINPRIHCLVPQLQPGDANRLMEGKRAKATLCVHRLQECTCGPFDALVFIHSGYYFTDYTEWKCELAKTKYKTAYVVGHKFDDAYGTTLKEEGHFGTHLFNGVPQIQMKVHGNAHAYIHPPLFWDQPKPILGDSDSSIDIELLTSLGDTHLWRLTLTTISWNAYTPVYGFGNQIVDPRHQGPTQTPGHDLFGSTGASANDALQFKFDVVCGWRQFIWTESREGFVIMPRGVLASVAKKFNQKLRNPASWADVNHYMVKAIDKARLPPDMQLAAATIGAAIAFNMNLHNEINVSQTQATRYGDWWKIHAQLVALTPIKVFNWFLWSFVLVCCLVVAILVLAYVPWDHHVVGLSLILIWALVCLVFMCCYCSARNIQAETIDYWSTNLYHERRASNIFGRAILAVRKRFTANPSLVQPLLPPVQGELAQLEEGNLRHPATVPEPLLIGGPVFSTSMPAVHQQGREADLVMITRRVMTENTDVDPAALALLRSNTARESRVLDEIRIRDDEAAFDSWVSQKKFPAYVQEKFRKLRELWKESDPIGFILRLFTKLEKDKMHTIDASAEHKPRGIAAPPDEVKALTGPAIAQIYSAVRKKWNGRKCRIVYASGYTPDELGAILDDFAERHGGYDNLRAVSDDMAIYDSTLQNELLKERERYKKMGMKERTFAWLNAARSRGISKYGIHFNMGEKEVDGQRVPRRNLWSGEMDTNLIGSIINGLAHIYGYPLDLDFLMFVCGDDNTTFGTKDELTHELIDRCVAYLKALGLKPTPIVSDRRCDWEFCSKLFWYATDPKTGACVTVLGPKPGRLLTRVGWSTTTPNALNFRGAMLGLIADVHHIPLLSQYVQKGLDLSSKQQARGREHSELKHVTRAYDPHPLNARLLMERYGIQGEHCLEFMRTLQAADRLEVVLNFPWVTEMARVDA